MVGKGREVVDGSERANGQQWEEADGLRPEEVLLAADRALFVAKRSGGGRVASAAEGMALHGEFTLQTPTPIDTLASPA